MKAIKFGFSVFQYKIFLLNIILSVNFTREAEIVTLTRNNWQLPSLFTDFKIRYKNTKIVIFYFTDSLVWYLLIVNYPEVRMYFWNSKLAYCWSTYIILTYTHAVTLIYRPIWLVGYLWLMVACPQTTSRPGLQKQWRVCFWRLPPPGRCIICGVKQWPA